MSKECLGLGPFIFRLNESGVGPQLLFEVCLERGWDEFRQESGEQWNLWWKTSDFSNNHHRNLYAWQYINHIPNGSTICKKDTLARYLRYMKKVYGPIYNFSPDGYHLPREYTKLAIEHNKESKKKGLIWICKPVAQSQGRGIFLFRNLSELNYDSNTIVQKYIEKPLLIGGYKFDLRLYVCVASYHPFTIYMYQEGLVRFSTSKFSLIDLKNPFRHLTNSSINKLGPCYTEMKERIGSGCKWTLTQLRAYFDEIGISDWLLWQRISSLVTMTLLSHVSHIPPTTNCFEFLGFDILIDDCLRPWLLEVNFSPALSNDCNADRIVKKPMLHDLFDLLGLPMLNRGLTSFHNSDEKNQEEENLLRNHPKNSSTVNVKPNKWKKCKSTSARQIISRTDSIDNLRMRRILSSSTKNSSKRASGLESSRSSSNEVLYSEENSKEDSTRNQNGVKKWKNCRNWSTPVCKEGDWVRTWPIKCNLNNNSSRANTTAKEVVSEITEYMKAVKDFWKTNPEYSEQLLNQMLQKRFQRIGPIWCPASDFLQ